MYDHHHVHHHVCTVPPPPPPPPVSYAIFAQHGIQEKKEIETVVAHRSRDEWH